LFRIAYILLLLIAVVLSSFQAHALTLTQREYQIKSAFIANFIRYTRWQPAPSEAFEFCTTSAGANNILSQSLGNEVWFELTPIFNVVSPGQELHCHLLFVDQLSNQQWGSYLATHPSANLLIVSETSNSARLYSHINFFFVDNKLRFEINPTRLKRANLNVSASLLRLARIVKPTSLNGGGI